MIIFKQGDRASMEITPQHLFIEGRVSKLEIEIFSAVEKSVYFSDLVYTDCLSCQSTFPSVSNGNPLGLKLYNSTDL